MATSQELVSQQESVETTQSVSASAASASANRAIRILSASPITEAKVGTQLQNCDD